MHKIKKRLISLIAGAVLTAFVSMECAQAAAWEPASFSASSLVRITQNPSLFETPADVSSLRETHAGTNGKILILVQDPHTNFSGQENLAATLDDILPRYGIRLVLSEGGAKDCSLTSLKTLASADVWKRLAKSYLIQGKISGEEYLNLVSDHPMKIVGLEDLSLYLQSVRSYAELADRRENILGYLARVRTANDKLKKKFYPDVLLDYEAAGTIGGSEEDFDKRIANLLAAAQSVKADADDLSSVSRLVELQLRERLVDFDAATIEQAALAEEIIGKGGDPKRLAVSEKSLKGSKSSLYAHFQNTFEIAKEKNVLLSKYPHLSAYVDYLKTFLDIDLEKALDELQTLEDRVYAKASASSRDALLVRSIDRYTGLLETAYRIKMTNKEFKTFEVNEPDFASASYLAFINRKLAENGFAEDLIEDEKGLEDARASLDAFYGSVGERDLAFVANAEKALSDEKQTAAILIAGGYHTSHLKKLLRQKGYSYVVLSPTVTSETNQKKYEKLLLQSLGRETKAVATVQGESRRDKSLTALDGDLKKPVKKTDGVRTAMIGIALKELEGADWSSAKMAPAAALIRSEIRQTRELIRDTGNTSAEAEKLLEWLDDYETRLANFEVRVAATEISVVTPDEGEGAGELTGARFSKTIGVVSAEMLTQEAYWSSDQITLENGEVIRLSGINRIVQRDLDVRFDQPLSHSVAAKALASVAGLMSRVIVFYDSSAVIKKSEIQEGKLDGWLTVEALERGFFAEGNAVWEVAVTPAGQMWKINVNGNIKSTYVVINEKKILSPGFDRYAFTRLGLDPKTRVHVTFEDEQGTVVDRNQPMNREDMRLRLSRAIENGEKVLLTLDPEARVVVFFPENEPAAVVRKVDADTYRFIFPSGQERDLSMDQIRRVTVVMDSVVTPARMADKKNIKLPEADVERFKAALAGLSVAPDWKALNEKIISTITFSPAQSVEMLISPAIPFFGAGIGRIEKFILKRATRFYSRDWLIRYIVGKNTSRLLSATKMWKTSDQARAVLQATIDRFFYDAASGYPAPDLEKPGLRPYVRQETILQGLNGEDKGEFRGFGLVRYVLALLDEDADVRAAASSVLFQRAGESAAQTEILASLAAALSEAAPWALPEGIQAIEQAQKEIVAGGRLTGSTTAKALLVPAIAALTSFSALSKDPSPVIDPGYFRSSYTELMLGLINGKLNASVAQRSLMGLERSNPALYELLAYFVEKSGSMDESEANKAQKKIENFNAKNLRRGGLYFDLDITKDIRTGRVSILLVPFLVSQMANLEVAGQTVPILTLKRLDRSNVVYGNFGEHLEMEGGPALIRLFADELRDQSKRKFTPILNGATQKSLEALAGSLAKDDGRFISIEGNALVIEQEALKKLAGDDQQFFDDVSRIIQSLQAQVGMILRSGGSVPVADIMDVLRTDVELSALRSRTLRENFADLAALKPEELGEAVVDATKKHESGHGIFGAKKLEAQAFGVFRPRALARIGEYQDEDLKHIMSEFVAYVYELADGTAVSKAVSLADFYIRLSDPAFAGSAEHQVAQIFFNEMAISARSEGVIPTPEGILKWFRKKTSAERDALVDRLFKAYTGMSIETFNEGATVKEVEKSGARFASIQELGQKLYSQVTAAREQSRTAGLDMAFYQVGDLPLYYLDADYPVLGRTLNRLTNAIEFSGPEDPIKSTDEVDAWVENIRQRKMTSSPGETAELQPEHLYYGPYGHDLRLTAIVRILNRAQAQGIELNAEERELILFLEAQKLIERRGAEWVALKEKAALIGIPRDIANPVYAKDETFDRDTVLHEFGHGFDFSTAELRPVIDAIWAELAASNEAENVRFRTVLETVIGDAGYNIQENPDLFFAELTAYLMDPATFIKDILRFKMDRQLIADLGATVEEPADSPAVITIGPRLDAIQARFAEAIAGLNAGELNLVHSRAAGSRMAAPLVNTEPMPASQLDLSEVFSAGWDQAVNETREVAIRIRLDTPRALDKFTHSLLPAALRQQVSARQYILGGQAGQYLPYSPKLEEVMTVVIAFEPPVRQPVAGYEKVEGSTRKLKVLILFGNYPLGAAEYTCSAIPSEAEQLAAMRLVYPNADPLAVGYVMRRQHRSLYGLLNDFDKLFVQDTEGAPIRMAILRQDPSAAFLDVEDTLRTLGRRIKEPEKRAALSEGMIFKFYGQVNQKWMKKISEAEVPEDDSMIMDFDHRMTATRTGLLYLPVQAKLESEGFAISQTFSPSLEEDVVVGSSINVKVFTEKSEQWEIAGQRVETTSVRVMAISEAGEIVYNSVAKIQRQATFDQAAAAIRYLHSDAEDADIRATFGSVTSPRPLETYVSHYRREFVEGKGIGARLSDQPAEPEQRTLNEIREIRHELSNWISTYIASMDLLRATGAHPELSAFLDTRAELLPLIEFKEWSPQNTDQKLRDLLSYLRRQQPILEAAVKPETKTVSLIKRVQNTVIRYIEVMLGDEELPSAVDVRSVLHETIALRRRSSDHVKVAEGEDIVIMTYPNALSRAIYNLVKNAAESTDGMREPLIVLDAVRKEGGRIEIRITNNGKGISANDLNRLNKGESFTTKGDEGNGIGAPMVRRFATVVSKGDLRFSSNGPGMGATVILTLPLDVTKSDARLVGDIYADVAGDQSAAEGARFAVERLLRTDSEIPLTIVAIELASQERKAPAILIPKRFMDRLSKKDRERLIATLEQPIHSGMVAVVPIDETQVGGVPYRALAIRAVPVPETASRMQKAFNEAKGRWSDDFLFGAGKVADADRAGGYLGVVITATNSANVSGARVAEDVSEYGDAIWYNHRHAKFGGAGRTKAVLIRYASQYRVLRDYLLDLMDEEKKDLRIFSMGASDGREPASVAAYLLWLQDPEAADRTQEDRQIGEWLRNVNIRIAAVDDTQYDILTRNLTSEDFTFTPDFEDTAAAEMVNRYLPQIRQKKWIEIHRIDLNVGMNRLFDELGMAQADVIFSNEVLRHLDAGVDAFYRGAVRSLKRRAIILASYADAMEVAVFSGLTFDKINRTFGVQSSRKPTLILPDFLATFDLDNQSAHYVRVSERSGVALSEEASSVGARFAAQVRLNDNALRSLADVTRDDRILVTKTAVRGGNRFPPGVFRFLFGPDASLVGQIRVVEAAEIQFVLPDRTVSEPIAEDVKTEAVRQILEDKQAGQVRGAGSTGFTSPSSQEQENLRDYDSQIKLTARIAKKAIAEHASQYNAARPVILRFTDVEAGLEADTQALVEKIQSFTGGPVFVQFGSVENGRFTLTGDPQNAEAFLQGEARSQTGVVYLGRLSQKLLNAAKGSGLAATPADAEGPNTSLFAQAVFAVLVQRFDAPIPYLEQLWKNLRAEGSQMALDKATFDDLREVGSDATLDRYTSLTFRIIRIAWDKMLQTTFDALRAVGGSA